MSHWVCAALLSARRWCSRVALVQAVHEVGGFGSAGYGYSWKQAESEKNLLRTHTTAVSSRILYRLANQPGGFK
jgi:phenylalanyl-tRNA synthetase alpha chain